MTAAEVYKFYDHVNHLNDTIFGKSDDYWNIWLNNAGDNVSYKLSFSLNHYLGKAGNNWKEVNWKKVKQYDISLDEPLIVFLKAIEECKHIVQQYRIDNL